MTNKKCINCADATENIAVRACSTRWNPSQSGMTWMQYLDVMGHCSDKIYVAKKVKSWKKWSQGFFSVFFLQISDCLAWWCHPRLGWTHVWNGAPQVIPVWDDFFVIWKWWKTCWTIKLKCFATSLGHDWLWCGSSIPGLHPRLGWPTLLTHI